MQCTFIKEQVKNLIDKMPDTSTWDDLMHQIYVRSTIEKGLEDSRYGRTVDVREVRAQYGLPE